LFSIQATTNVPLIVDGILGPGAYRAGDALPTTKHT